MGERAARIMRRVVWPVALLLLVGSAGAAVAQTATQAPPVAAPLTSGWTGRLAAEDLESVLAPEPTATPAPQLPQLTIVFPPPPATGAAASRAERARAKIAASGVSTPAQWCAGSPTAAGSASSVRGLLAAANAERSLWGLPALTWSDGLASAAQSWSDTMAAESIAADRGASFRHGGVPAGSGQNIAVYWEEFDPAPPDGYVTPLSTAMRRAHAGWVASTAHCNNMLDAGWTSMGAGAAVSADGLAWYSTVNFG